MATSPIATPQVYTNLKTWQKDHQKAYTTFSSQFSEINAQYFDGEITEAQQMKKFIALWNDYENKKSEIGDKFDFMERKKASNNKDYNGQINKLAQGELQQKDINGDGVISWDEYINAVENNNSEMELTDEERSEAIEFADKMFTAIDKRFCSNGFLVDGNDELNVKDLEFFYMMLDAYEYNDEVKSIKYGGILDGKIDIESFNGYISDFENFNSFQCEGN